LTRISFIHAADLHLDSPFKGITSAVPSKLAERVKESSFTSLKRIIDTAIERKVDFVLFAGDIYDSAHRSIRAQMKFRKEMERLQEMDIAVFLIHGNHDYLVAKGNRIDLPRNVYVFSERVEKVPFIKNNVTIAYIYGFA
jgi:DNA repair protein SbcD/Mre11